MTILPAEQPELPQILEVYRQARSFMAASGNPDQWGDSYPPQELVESDIRKKQLYVCKEGHTIWGVFVFFRGKEPTYSRIYEGSWLAGEDYGVIHRVAVSVRGRSVASEIFSWCSTGCSQLRIDTHEKNLPMQRALLKNGFQKRGTICLENGEARIAFQKLNGPQLPV